MRARVGELGGQVAELTARLPAEPERRAAKPGDSFAEQFGLTPVKRSALKSRSPISAKANLSFSHERRPPPFISLASSSKGPIKGRIVEESGEKAQLLEENLELKELLGKLQAAMAKERAKHEEIEAVLLQKIELLTQTNHKS